MLLTCHGTVLRVLLREGCGNKNVLSAAFDSRSLHRYCFRFFCALPSRNVQPAVIAKRADVYQGKPAMSNEPIRIAVEGNIGSGKSSLVKYFSQFPDYEGIEEAVHQWCNVQGNNLLGLLYQDPKRYSFMFQHYIQYIRTEMHTRPCTKPVKIIERSLQNNRYCFSELAFKSKYLTSEEFTVLNEWYNWVEKNLNIHLDLIVYLQTDPIVVHERMKHRGRPEEKGVPLQYLCDLHNSYEDWLIKGSSKNIPAPVVVLDANQELPKMIVEYKKLRTALEEKLREKQ